MARTLELIISNEKPEIVASAYYEKYKQADMEMLEAYDCGEYTYEDAIRFCIKSASRLAYGWN